MLVVAMISGQGEDVGKAHMHQEKVSAYSVEKLLLIWVPVADSIVPLILELIAMMGPRQESQTALFYDLSIEDHVPVDHVLRAIDVVIDLPGSRYAVSMRG